MSKGKEKEKQIQMEQFEQMIAELEREGYTREDGVISFVKANVMACVTAGPFFILAIVLYLVIHQEAYASVSGSEMFKVFVILILSVGVHEFLHGFTWHFFCKEKWNSIRFGFQWKTLTPYCHCIEVLPAGQYVLGGIMPFLILGVVPSILGIAMHNFLVTLFGAFSILCAGGDTTIVWMARKYRSSLLLDHPSAGGFIAFTKR